MEALIDIVLYFLYTRDISYTTNAIIKIVDWGGVNHLPSNKQGNMDSKNFNIIKLDDHSKNKIKSKQEAAKVDAIRKLMLAFNVDPGAGQKSRKID